MRPELDRPLRAAVIQDAADGRVLMVGWVDDAALEATRRTGLVHFHSRSRGRLWRKGETSGNTLRVHSIATDCDGDAYLILADPAGPTCHTGSRSCFDAGADAGDVAAGPAAASDPSPGAPAREAQGFDALEVLWATIESRRAADPASSYTARLLAGGVDSAGRKVVEEATEVLMAAKDDAVAPDLEVEPSSADRSGAVARTRLTEEAADLVYHLLVLLAERRVEPREVLAVLRQRSAVRSAADPERGGRQGSP